MKRFICLFTLFIIYGGQAFASYTLDLKPQKWDFTPTAFYIEAVKDDRSFKSDLGQVLQKDSSTRAFFRNSLETDLLGFINYSMAKDTGRIPVILVVKKMALSETGNFMKHVAKLDYSFKFYSKINGRLNELLEVKGIPQYEVSGDPPFIYEQLIENVLKIAMSNFNSWIDQNRNQLSLMRVVKLVNEKPINFSQLEKNDTILWCPNLYRLRWSDFHLQAPESDYSAESNCMFLFSSRPELNPDTLTLHIGLSAFFDRTTSWVKEDAKSSDSLLMHEQLHFDICELYIRKLRKKMMQLILDPMDYIDKCNGVFDEIWRDYQEAQKLYDKETEHGLIANEQNRWISEVAEQLEMMKAIGVSECE